MSISHQSEILPIRQIVRPVPNRGKIFHFDHHLLGTGSGQVIRPLGGYVATIRPGEGRFGGGAVAVEEGTTNLWTNPGWLDGTLSGWIAYSTGGATGERQVVPDGRFGYALRLTKVDSGAGRWGVHQSKTWHSTGSVIADSVYVKVLSAQTGAKLLLYSDYRDINGNALYGRGFELGLTTMTIQARTNGARHLTLTPVGDGWYRVEFVTNDNDIVSGPSYFWIEGAPAEVLLAYSQKEAKPFPTSFVDGTRYSENLVYDTNEIGITPEGDWTILGWYKKNAKQSVYDNWAALFQMGNYYREGESEFQIWTNHHGDFKAWSHQNKIARQKILFTPNDDELIEWFFVGVTRQGDSMRFYIHTRDRELVDSWTLSHDLPIAPRLRLGGQWTFNGLIDELLILPYAATQEEILSWYHADAPLMDPTSPLGVAL